MHLCLFISQLHGGGAERVALTLAGAWNRNPRIARVTVVTGLDEEKSDPSLAAGIGLIRLPLQARSKTRLAAITANARRIRQIRGAMHQLRPDAVIAFMDEMGVLVSLAAQGTGIPVIAALRAEPSGPDLKGIWRSLRVPVYRHLSDAVVVQTQAGLEQAAALFPGATLHCIGNPLPALPPARSMTERAPIIASAGRLIPSKRFDLLIEAFSRSRYRDLGWRLRIHGEGPERRRLEDKIAGLDLADAVEIPGYSADVYALMGEAAIFAFASRSEGFPNALLEAAAMGCACVSTDCNAGPREILDHGRFGLLVPVDDCSAMTDALNRLMSNTGLRAELAGHWPEFRSNHDEVAVAQRWIDLAAALVEPACVHKRDFAS
jgi:GalNAc-alpha-(1->4)-GalNAc-alpha-(1->3)-diNAcBac-PP-undecaprenol alpha-1,4-N-acetyl-D-galactosaminyltransferase